MSFLFPGSSPSSFPTTLTLQDTGWWAMRTALSQLLSCAQSSSHFPWASLDPPTGCSPSGATDHSSVGSSWATASSRAEPPALTCCPPGSACWRFAPGCSSPRATGESLFQLWEHLLLSSSDLGVLPAVSCCFNCCRAVLSPSRLFLRYHQPGCGLSCALEWMPGAGWKQLCQAEGVPCPFLLEATPEAPTPGAINLATLPNTAPRKEASPPPKPLCTVLPPHLHPGDVGEANASHLYWGHKIRLFQSCQCSSVNTSLFSL